MMWRQRGARVELTRKVRGGGTLELLKNVSEYDAIVPGIESKKHALYSEEVWRPHDSGHLDSLISELSKKIEYEWQEYGFERPELRVRAVLEEAALNAWTHGNNKIPGTSVTVRWRCGDDFALEIADDGPGFDYECIPDPTAGENLTKPFGRGIFIIRYFARDVSWAESGKRVIITLDRHFDSPQY